MAESSDLIHIDVNKNVAQPVSNGNELCFVSTDDKLNDISNCGFQQSGKRDISDVESSCLATLNKILTDTSNSNDCIHNSHGFINQSSANDSSLLLPTSPEFHNSSRNVMDETFSFSRNASSSSNNVANEVGCLVEANVMPLQNGSNLNLAENTPFSHELKCQSSQDVSAGSVLEVNRSSSENLIRLSGENLEAKCMPSQDSKSLNFVDDLLSSTQLKDLSQDLLIDTFAPKELSAMLSQVPSTCSLTESIPSPTANVSNETSNSELLKSNIDFSCSESIVKGSMPPYSNTSSNSILLENVLFESHENNGFKTSESSKSIDDTNISIPAGTLEDNLFKSPFPVNDNDEEEFTDAVQFFKDPSSLQFLENIQTSVPSESTVPRSSLYVTFDPLLSKFRSEQSKPAGVLLNSEQITTSSVSNETVNSALPENVEVTARESMGNILLSFDSPVVGQRVENNQPEATSMSSVPKLYTEEELQKQLKDNELQLQDTYLKQHRVTEDEMKGMEKEKDIKLDRLSKLCNAQLLAIEDLINITTSMVAQNKDMRGKLKQSDEENNRLKEDVKVAGEDLQSVESTFSDFHKRYEQCKGMLKTYKENETFLKVDIDNWKLKFNEQLHMYSALEERTNETLEITNAAAASAKKSSDAQVAVLKAQLKKAELKISSLESDIKQMRIENDKLGGICDDLMAKVRET